MNIRKKQRFAAALIAAALTLTLAGCGDDREYVEPKDSGSSRGEKTSDTESSKPSDISGDPSDTSSANDPEPDTLKVLDMWDFLPEIPVTDVSKFEYIYDEYYGGIVITDFLTDETAVRIPDMIDGKPVVRLKLNSKVYIPEPELTMGEDPYECAPGYKVYNITELILPDTIFFIDVGVYDGVGRGIVTNGPALKNVKYMNLPQNFAGCTGHLLSLEKLYIDEGRRYMQESEEFINIGDDLSDVYIPTTIGAFSPYFFSPQSKSSPNIYYCDKNYNGYTDELHHQINDVNGDGILIKNNFYNHNNDITIVDFFSSKDEVIIPKEVTIIGAGSFSRSNIKKLSVPANVQLLGGLESFFSAYGCFNSCSDLIEITFEKGSQLENILASFNNCPNLKKISIPDSVTQIEQSFVGCPNITDITLGDNVSTDIKWEEVFSACKNNPDLVIHYKGEDFTSFKILREVMNGADLDAIKKGFEINDGVLIKYTGSDKNVVIPDNVTRIGENAFSNCENITSINIPSGVFTIGDSAFAGCSNLTEVRLPDFVKLEGLFIGYDIHYEPYFYKVPFYEFHTFDGCTKIKVYYKGKTYDYAHIEDLYKLFNTDN